MGKVDEDKIMLLDSHELMGASGESGDRVQFTEFIQKNLHLYQFRNNMMLSTVATANFTRAELATALRKINLRRLDGIQGPIYVGTGSVFNETALYGYEPPIKKKTCFFSSLCGGRKKTSKLKKSLENKNSHKHADSSVPVFNLEDIEEGVEGSGFDDEKSLIMSQMSLERRFGQSNVFVASTLMEYVGVPRSATLESLLKEAIHVISCGYEDKSDWGSEIRRAEAARRKMTHCLLAGWGWRKRHVERRKSTVVVEERGTRWKPHA